MERNPGKNSPETIQEESLRRRVALAARNAPNVRIDRQTGLDTNTLGLMNEFIEVMKTGEDLELVFKDLPNSVYVENLQSYPELIMLGLRQILKTNFGLTEKQLNSKKYQKYYADWYKQNSDYQMKHEGEHDEMVKKHTNLKTRLGIRFIKTKKGTLIIPTIDLEGTVSRKILFEKIVIGPENPSKADLYLLRAYNEIIGKHP